MCDTCGCDETGDVKITNLNHQHSDHHHEHMHNGIKHSHSHTHNNHDHSHNHDQPSERIIQVKTDIMHKNNLSAHRNRGYFDAKKIFSMNLVSSPGSGKTSLIEKTITELKPEYDFYVIEGDQQTLNDAKRIKEVGAPVVQINTGNGCHLDADMINRGIKELDPSEKSIVIIENVGNLVCPALFDLGESKRIVIISVTEGDDKPLKYPNMFHSSNLCIINKIDLLPYVDFNTEQAIKFALQVNRHLEFIELSVKTNYGMSLWFDWLRQQHNNL
jgi:hydrogenase nickel incorporation protein HypB